MSEQVKPLTEEEREYYRRFTVADIDEHPALGAVLPRAIAKIDALTAENERLRVAVKKHAVKLTQRMVEGGGFTDTGAFCAECKAECRVTETLTHKDGCILKDTTP